MRAVLQTSMPDNGAVFFLFSAENVGGPTVPIHEPGAYATMMGLAMLGYVGFRRMRKAQ